jgi:hypothetical protein
MNFLDEGGSMAILLGKFYISMPAAESASCANFSTSSLAKLLQARHE